MAEAVAPPNVPATIMPCLRYRDAPAAIEWLCQTFGFVKHAVYPTPDGAIAHAQLVFGNGMVMLASASMPSPWGACIRQPEDAGGMESQAPYVVVADADEIYRRAKAAGAAMVIDIRDEDYGGRGFVCRDLEGHLWSFGTYNPW